MNWYLKGKLVFLIVIFGGPFWIWLTEDILQLGLYNWIEQKIGKDYGFVAWFIFWALAFWLLWKLVFRNVQKRSQFPYRLAVREFRKNSADSVDLWKNLCSLHSSEDIRGRSHAANLEVGPEVTEKALALRDVLQVVATSAALINEQKASMLFEAGEASLANMVQGSFLIGVEYGKRNPPGTCPSTKQNLLPPEVDEQITEITQPLVRVVISMVELSHCPGRVKIFEEDIESLKGQLLRSIFSVAAECFGEGVKAAGRMI